MTVRDASQSTDSVTLSSSSPAGDSPPYRSLDVPVPGGALHVGESGDPGGPPVVLVHGITASHHAWDGVVRLLPDHRLLAPDLRGRGRSNRVTGPAGIARHAEDLAAVLDAAGVPQAVVVGHSMGGFVATALAAQHPDRVSRLVLVDGGLPLPLPDGVGPDAAVAAALGPALARLTMTFPDHATYRAFWREHPALAAGWSPDVEAYVDYDLEPVPGPGGAAWRSAVRKAPVQDDARDLHDVEAVSGRLAALACPVTFLRAPRGLLDQPEGMYPEGVLEQWAARLPSLTGRTVPGVNHYTLLFAPSGAAAVAAAIRTG